MITYGHKVKRRGVNKMNFLYDTIRMVFPMLQETLLISGFMLIPATIITLVALRNREKRSGYSLVATGVFFLSILLIAGTFFGQMYTFIVRSRAINKTSCDIEHHVKDSVTVEVGKTYDIHYFVNEEAVTDFIFLDRDYQEEWFAIYQHDKVKINSVPEGKQATFPIQYSCVAHTETNTEWVTIEFK